MKGTKTLTNYCVPFRVKSNNVPSKGSRKEISQDAKPYFPKTINPAKYVARNKNVSIHSSWSAILYLSISIEIIQGNISEK